MDGLTLFCGSELAPPHSQSHPPHLPGSLLPAGSDQWKMAERKLFNKGIAIYKKDFFLVQKLVSQDSVARASGAVAGEELPACLGGPCAVGALPSLTKHLGQCH